MRKNEINWRDAVAADVDALPERRSTTPKDSTKVTVDFRGGVYGFLLEAARSRRLSVAAYVRRATMAMVAHDIGAGVRALTRLDPRMSRENGFGVSDPEAEIFGPWEIKELSDGE